MDNKHDTAADLLLSTSVVFRNNFKSDYKIYVDNKHELQLIYCCGLVLYTENTSIVIMKSVQICR